MATENDVARGVMIIAAAQPNGVATFARCKKEIPNIVNLSAANKAQSKTRPNEPMWHQLLRNIKSHHISDENYIARGWLVHIPRVGFRITPTGRKQL